jgi:hypothetical protein
MERVYERDVQRCADDADGVARELQQLRAKLQQCSENEVDRKGEESSQKEDRTRNEEKRKKEKEERIEVQETGISRTSLASDGYHDARPDAGRGTRNQGPGGGAAGGGGGKGCC